MYLRVLFIVLCVIAITNAQDDSTPHNRFRDKRTLDFILHGLAQFLGYKLEKQNSSASLVSTPAPTSPPVVLIVNEKRKQDAHNNHRDNYQHYKSDNDFNYYKSDRSRDKIRNNDFNYYNNDKIRNNDYNYFNHGRPYGDFNSNSKNDHLYEIDKRKNYEFGDFNKNDELFRKGNGDNKSKTNRDKVDDYLEKVRFFVKNQLKDGKNVKVGMAEIQNERKTNNSENRGNFYNKNYADFKHFERLSEDLHKSEEEAPSKVADKNEGKKTDFIKISQKCNDTDKDKQSNKENESAKTQQANVQQNNRSNSDQPVPSKVDKHHNEFHGNNYFNQVPAPSLQNWEQDFWNNEHYTATPSNHYNYQIPDFNIDGSENKDFHNTPDYTFHGPEQNNPLPEHTYPRPQYSEGDNYEPLHEWDISPGAISDNPQQSTEQTVLTSNKNSAIRKQDLPMPDHSTARPKLAELIHEIEGTKQNPLWPPPFDQAFEGTDSSIKSPLVLNLYNYTTVSDYLLDMNKKQTPASYIAVVVPNKPQPSFYGVLYPQQSSKHNKVQNKKASSLQQQETNHAKLGLYYRDFDTT